MRTLLVAALFLACTWTARSAGAQQPLVGYTPASAAHEREVESDAIRRPDPSKAATFSRELSREVHVSGTPAQARTRDYVIAQMKSWGLETSVRSYDIWMPHPTEVRVWRVSPDTHNVVRDEEIRSGGSPDTVVLTADQISLMPLWGP